MSGEWDGADTRTEAGRRNGRWRVAKWRCVAGAGSGRQLAVQESGWMT